MEKIVSIEELFGVEIGSAGTFNEKLGIDQMIGVLMGGGCLYDGYKIVTSEHEYMILIDNGQSCCESWGYFSSEDDFERFIGKELVSIELTDTALNKRKLEEKEPYGLDGGGIQFVDFKMKNGSVLQFAVYNAHNGFYGHSIIISKDNEIILNDVL